MPTCFVIMPVTTPEAIVPHYGGDTEHFRHVLECLFIPAIRAANLDPIPPIAQGSDVIHATIIKNLVSSDLVLCDISALNPNVFFELGCRTVLNKPVCYVKDDLTGRIPFDNSIINHHTYRAALRPWSMHDEVGALSKHIVESCERSQGQNQLWHYFGVQAVAESLKPDRGEKVDKLDVLMMQMELLKKSVEEAREVHRQSTPQSSGVFPLQGFIAPSMTCYLPETMRMTDYSPWTTWAIDHQKVLSDAASDIEQIETMMKPDSPPGLLQPVKDTLRNDIRSLNDALSSGLASPDAQRARQLIKRAETLLRR